MFGYLKKQVIGLHKKEDDMSRSKIMLDTFAVRDKRRNNILVFIIAQNEKQLSETLLSNYQWKIKHSFEDRAGNDWWYIGSSNYWSMPEGQRIGGRTFKTIQVRYPKYDSSILE